MKNTEEMVKSVIGEINERNEEECEERVRHLVKEILSDKARINDLLDRVAKHKAELKELQKPTEVSLELL